METKSEGDNDSQPADKNIPLPDDIAEKLTQSGQTIASLKDDVATLTSTTKMLSTDIEKLLDWAKTGSPEMRRIVDNKVDTKKFDRLCQDIEKVEDRLGYLMEDVGFGEGINLSKIPPNILEMVYLSTLDELVPELFKLLGAHDAELTIRQTLEDVRRTTSGTELFAFDGQRLRPHKLAQTIEKKLVSAKQMHVTYEAILNSLLEHLPNYRAKNFKAMIKVKSQEYAVDKTTHLLSKISELEEQIRQDQEIISELSANVNRIIRDVDSDVDKRSEEVERNVDSKFAQINQRLDDLSSNVALKEQIDELGSSVRELIRRFDMMASAAPGQTALPESAVEKGATGSRAKSADAPSKPKTADDKQARSKKSTSDEKGGKKGGKKVDVEHVLPEEEKLIYDTIIAIGGFTGMSIETIIDRLGGLMPRGRIEEVIESLVGKKMISVVGKEADRKVKVTMIGDG